MNQTSSRRALRRLLIIAAFAAGLVIFSYGWSVTDINLERPQEPVRQQNVGNALRQLLSPNVFEQDYEITSSTASFLVDCPSDGGVPTSQSAPASDSGQPTITITPTCAQSGEKVTVEGVNFAPNSLARINWIDTTGERRIRRVAGAEGDNFVTRGDGTFTVQIEVPRIRGSAGQTHTIEAQGSSPSGPPRFSNTTALVLQKMVETIFLALIATSLSILPSAILSFFAAHNLMRPVRMSLGNLLVSVALLPVGWVIGTQLLSQLGVLGVNLGRGAGLSTSAISSASFFLLFAATTTSRVKAAEIQITSGERLRGVLNTVLIVIGVTFIIGLIGGFAILFGRAFTEGVLGYVSHFIGTIGELIRLSIVPISGIIGAFALSSIATSLTIDALKKVDVTTAHVLGGALGLVCGAIVMGVTALIGMQAAWLGLLPPVIAASMGGGILTALYRRFTSPVARMNRASQSLESTLSWLGAAAVFVITFIVLNVGSTIITGTLPASDITTNLLGLSIPVYITEAMLIGAVLGGVSGLMAGTKAAFPVGEILYNITRTVLNALRSIEPLIMGLVFVIWVGIGPFAGVLALTLHSIASLGKLYSEQIESIDTGPIEALQSTGANRLQTIMFAVVPQIIPPYIAFTMYRWDINVRMSTIIGFVGGGGVGFLLQQQINLLRYRDAGVAVLAIAIVVSILDYASASIRERVI